MIHLTLCQNEFHLFIFFRLPLHMTLQKWVSLSFGDHVYWWRVSSFCLAVLCNSRELIFTERGRDCRTHPKVASWTEGSLAQENVENWVTAKANFVHFGSSRTPSRTVYIWITEKKIQYTNAHISDLGQITLGNWSHYSRECWFIEFIHLENVYMFVCLI